MKHNKAYCKNGKIYEPSDIKNRNSLVDMRYYGLTDLNKEFELVVVNSTNPFFRYKNSPGINLTRKENNPNHNIVKESIFEKLKNAKSLMVYTNEFLDNKPIESSIINLNEDIYSTYCWKMETFKKISSTEYSYFDICGFSKEIPFSTTVKPTIFIEVIVSSFLKNRVFEFHCKYSKIDNTICLLFYIPETLNKNILSSYWNKLEEKENCLKIRVTYFIDNGYFYEGKKQIVHLARDLKNDDDEYVRPKFNSYEEEKEYWDKHHIYIKENYVKKALKKIEK